MFIRLAKRSVGVGGILIAVAAAAQAQGPAQFASFSQASAQNTPFRYFYDSVTPSNSRFGLYNASGVALTGASALDVNFQFQITNGYGSTPGSNIAAKMEMTTLVDGIVSGGTTPGSTISQNFQFVRMTFTAVTPSSSGQTNLLTVIGVFQPPSSAIDPDIPEDNGSKGTTASLAGRIGTSTASFDATEVAGADINFIGFSSDFIDFGTPQFVNRNFSLGLSNVSPSVARAGASSPAFDYFRSFTASATGSFGSDPIPAIPEPGSLALLATGLSGALVTVRRRRRVAEKTQ